MQLDDIKKELKEKGEIVIHVRATPGSAVSKIIEILEDETVKIAISAPPEKGKANKELVKFLNKEFGVEKYNISIISGGVTKNKLVKMKLF